jgi:hypothetical protein
MHLMIVVNRAAIVLRTKNLVSLFFRCMRGNKNAELSAVALLRRTVRRRQATACSESQSFFIRRTQPLILRIRGFQVPILYTAHHLKPNGHLCVKQRVAKEDFGRL